MVPYCRIIRACFISNSITNITEIDHVCAKYYRFQISENITDVRYHRTLQMMTYMETTPQYQLWVSSMYSDEDSTDC